MASIVYDRHVDRAHSSLAQIGTAGLYYVAGLTMIGLVLMVGANSIVAGALQGLVAVLSGAA